MITAIGRVNLAPLLVTLFILELASSSEYLARPSVCLAEELSVRAEAFNRSATDLKENNTFEDERANHLQLYGRMEYQKTDEFDAVLSTKLDHFYVGNGSDNSDELDLRLDDAYLQFRGERSALRLGSQVVIWGKADELSPLNNVNPEELRDGIVRRRAERKLAIPMANLELFDQYTRFQALFIPLFQKSEIALADNDWAYLGNINERYPDLEIERINPSDSFKNAEYGLRLSQTWESWDYGFSYLFSRSDLPSIETLQAPPGFSGVEGTPSVSDLAEFAQTTGQPIVLDYQQQRTLGAELETVWGDYGLRGDLAYVAPVGFISGEDLQRKNKDVIRYVVGSDYSSEDGLYVNLQFGQDLILKHQSELLFSDAVTSSLFGEVSKEYFDGKLKPGLRYFYNLTTGGIYFNPAVSTTYWEDLIIELGLDLLDSSSDTLLGTYRDNDQVYLSFKYFSPVLEK